MTKEFQFRLSTCAKGQLGVCSSHVCGIIQYLSPFNTVHIHFPRCMVATGDGAVNGADLSKGLAAYMASATAITQNTRNDDDMSISSSEAGSKQGQITPGS